MHELTLFAHVPNARVDHIKRALTAITGMTPKPVLEHHLIYKPKRNRQTVGVATSGTTGAASTAAAAAADFYFLKLVAEILDSERNLNLKQDKDGTTATTTTVTEEQKEDADGDAMEIDSTVSGTNPSKREAPAIYNVRKQRWSIRFADLPEVSGKRPVTSRMIHSAAIHEGNALAFVDSLGYSLISEYVVSGCYFVYHNIHITVTRVMLPYQPSNPFPLDSLQPLDPADSYILQASIKVHSANEQETMNRGVEELKLLKSELRGVVDLDVGDRLSLDTRVR